MCVCSYRGFFDASCLIVFVTFFPLGLQHRDGSALGSGSIAWDAFLVLSTLFGS